MRRNWNKLPITPPIARSANVPGSGTVARLAGETASEAAAPDRRNAARPDVRTVPSDGPLLRPRLVLKITAPPDSTDRLWSTGNAARFVIIKVPLVTVVPPV